MTNTTAKKAIEYANKNALKINPKNNLAIFSRRTELVLNVKVENEAKLSGMTIYCN